MISFLGSLSKDQMHQVQLQTNYQDGDLMGFRWFQWHNLQQTNKQCYQKDAKREGATATGLNSAHLPILGLSCATETTRMIQKLSAWKTGIIGWPMNWQIRWLEQFTATKEASCGFVCVVLQGQWKYSTVNFNYVIMYNLKMTTFQLQFFGLLWGMHPDSSASKPRCWHQDSSASSRFNHHRVGEHNGSKSRSQKSLAAPHLESVVFVEKIYRSSSQMWFVDSHCSQRVIRRWPVSDGISSVTTSASRLSERASLWYGSRDIYDWNACYMIRLKLYCVLV